MTISDRRSGKDGNTSELYSPIYPRYSETMPDKADAHLPHALRILARDIYCEDGIATQCIREAADEIDRLRLQCERLTVSNDIMETRLEVAWQRGRLTDADREAIRRAAQVAAEFHDSKLLATLRGLLERLAADRPEPIATGDNDRPKPIATIPPEWLSKPYWVDPPSGWRYGFPRLYDPASDGDMTEWMIANGYPEQLARKGLACTFTAMTEDGEK